MVSKVPFPLGPQFESGVSLAARVLLGGCLGFVEGWAGLQSCRAESTLRSQVRGSGPGGSESRTSAPDLGLGRARAAFLPSEVRRSVRALGSTSGWAPA